MNTIGNSTDAGSGKANVLRPAPGPGQPVRRGDVGALPSTACRASWSSTCTTPSPTADWAWTRRRHLHRRRVRRPEAAWPPWSARGSPTASGLREDAVLLSDPDHAGPHFAGSAARRHRPGHRPGLRGPGLRRPEDHGVGRPRPAVLPRGHAPRRRFLHLLHGRQHRRPVRPAAHRLAVGHEGLPLGLRPRRRRHGHRPDPVLLMRRPPSAPPYGVPNPLPKAKYLPTFVGTVIVAVLVARWPQHRPLESLATIVTVLAGIAAVVLWTQMYASDHRRRQRRLVGFIDVRRRRAVLRHLPQRFTVIAIYADQRLDRMISSFSSRRRGCSRQPIFIIIFSGIFAAMWTKLGSASGPTR